MTEIPDHLLNRAQAATQAARAQAPRSRGDVYANGARAARQFTIQDLMQWRHILGDADASIRNVSEAFGVNSTEITVMIKVIINQINQEIGALT